MRKTVKIGDQDIDFEANASVILVYHQNFGSDYFTDVTLAMSAFNENGTINIKHLRTDLMAQIIYTFAKVADNKLSDCEEWLGSFELGDFDVNKIFGELVEFIFKDLKSVKKN